VDLSRRTFLRGAGAGAAGTALAATAVVGGIRADAASITPATTAAPVAFHGANQAGVFTPVQPEATFAAFDVTAESRGELIELFRTLTNRARFLTAGGTPEDLGVGLPPTDSAVVGDPVAANGLSITVAVGAGLFDDRYGLAAQRPTELTTMPSFPDDALDPAWCHGDLLLQVCAQSRDTVHHALRDIAKRTRGAIQPRYRMDGFASPPRPSGTPRNLLGFKDGIANPGPADDLVWLPAAETEPAWTAGGTYQVVRLIRMYVEFWDRVTITEQEKMFGRRRDTGAPLDGSAESDVPNYTADPEGTVIPLDAHIRLANPRTPETAATRLLRRGYNYERGFDSTGNLDAGLVFCSYQRSITAQFEATQNRLAGEPLTDYIKPFGGGYFFALPGVASADDWYARRLLA